MDTQRPDNTALMVDDEPPIRQQCAEALRERGYTVAEAGDGWEALKWLEGNPPPACIVLDIMLPRMDGLQVLEWRLDTQRVADVPVVALAPRKANDLFHQFAGMDRRWVDELRVAAVIYKPMQRPDLLAAVSETVAWLVAGGRGIPPWGCYVALR
ncbi:MAG TPA: response regulator [Armatimonadota bacterium]|jgi:CheY-like chemotaxis protein